jgi:hypothetical protein
MIPQTDIDRLKADINANFAAFSVKLFKDLPNTNPHFTENKAYYNVPGYGRLSQTKRRFFPEKVKKGEAIWRDHIWLWQEIKSRTFPQAYSEIRKWIDSEEASTELANAENERKTREKSEKREMHAILFAKGNPSVQTGSAEEFRKILGLEKTITVKSMAVLLRKCKTDTEPFIVEEIPVGKIRNSKGGKSKYRITDNFEK